MGTEVRADSRTESGRPLTPPAGQTARSRGAYFDRLLRSSPCVENPPLRMLRPKGATDASPFAPETTLEKVQAMAAKLGFADAHKIVEIPETGIFVGGLIVTPKIARNILKTYAGDNRRVTEKEVNAISRDIDAERFALTHQGIAFRSDGITQDGQHRLSAVAQSKSAVKILCFFNVCDQAKAVSDCGRPRSESDVYRIVNNYEISSLAGGAIKRAHFGMMPDKKYSRSEGLALIKAYQYGLCEVVLAQFERREKRITQAGVLGALVRAYYHYVWDGGANLVDVREKQDQKELLLRFCAVLRGETPDGVREDSPARLRDQLISANKDTANRFYRLTCRALRWYMEWQRGAQIPQDGFGEITNEIFKDLPGHPFASINPADDDDID